MKTYILGLAAAEVVHLLRAETEAAHGALELDVGAPEREYVIQEDFEAGPTDCTMANNLIWSQR